MDEDATKVDGTTTADPDATRVGTTTFIGRYEVVRLLGRGGMGEVYLAHDPVLDRKVAVKLIGREMDDQEARRRLVHEARAAGRLRHPNIVTIFDAGEHEGAPYIAMEHVEGETLRALVRRRAPLPLARRLELVESACAGLAHAHRANVVHFDVKPDNLMLDANGILKVLDFGIARVLKNEMLVTQHVVGTLRYMSPEQAAGHPLDRRSDVFSLGSSLFELVAYAPAYAGSAHEIITRITAGPVPRLTEVVPSVDSRLDALVSRAMSLEPADRFDDLDELAAELSRLRVELDPSEGARRSSSSVAVSAASMSTVVDAPTARRRTHRAVLAGAGAAGVLAIGLGAAWVLAPRPQPEGYVAASPVAEGAAPGATAPPQPVTAPPRPDAPPSVAPTGAPRGNGGRATAQNDRAGVSERQASTTAPPPPQIQTPPQETPGPPRSVQPPPVATVDTPRAEASPAPAQVETTGTRSTPTAPLEVAPPVQAPGETDGVLAAIRRYHDAYKALDAAGVRQMYPTLGPDQFEQLRRSFDATAAYEVDARQPRVEVRNDTATVRALVVRRIAPKVGRAVTNEVDTEFRLRRDPRGWVITDVRATKP